MKPSFSVHVGIMIIVSFYASVKNFDCSISKERISLEKEYFHTGKKFRVKKMKKNFEKKKVRGINAKFLYSFNPIHARGMMYDMKWFMLL